jgi:hypothetical protein
METFIMITRYFLTIAAFLAATVAQSSDDVINRQIIDGKLYENGECVFNMVEHSDSDDEMAANSHSFSLPTLPTTTATPQVNETESIPAGNPLRTVTTGRVTKPRLSQSAPTLPVARREIPKLRKEGNGKPKGVTEELYREISQFNDAAETTLKHGGSLEPEAAAFYAVTQNFDKISGQELRKVANFAEDGKFDIKKLIEKYLRV